MVNITNPNFKPEYDTHAAALDAHGLPSLVGASAITIKPSGDTDDYFTLSTLTNVPTIFGTGAYVRIGDAAFTSNSLASEDDLLVTGKLEVDGPLYADGGIAVIGDISRSGAGQSALTLTTTVVDLLATTDIRLRQQTGNSIRFMEYLTGVTYGDWKIVRVQKTYTSDLFDAVGLTDSATIWTQPANTVLISVKMRLVTQFAATSLTDLDVTMGLAGDNDGLLSDTMNLTSDAAATEYKTRGAYWNTSALGAFWYAAAATDWVAYATAVGANLSTLSAGQLDFYIMYLQL